MTKPVADAIAAAAEMVADGRFDADFPIDAFQTGSGTSSNMNANEVHRPVWRPTRSAMRCTRTIR